MADLNIKFKIVTPERTVFEDEIDQATLPVTGGEVTILPEHQSYIASLSTGEIMIKKGKNEVLLFVSGGFLEFHANLLTVLADTAERAEEINLKLAEEAKTRAEKLQGEAAVAANIQKHAARIRVAQKHYTKRGIKLGE